MIKPYNGRMDFDMKHAIIVLSLLVAAVWGVVLIRRFAGTGSGEPASEGASAQEESPALKAWVNNSVDEEMPPGNVPRHRWAGDDERERLSSAWAVAATNLSQGNVQCMKQTVAAISERMKSIPPEQFHVIVSPFYSLLKDEFVRGIMARTYANPAEFKKSVLVNIDGMNVLGNVEFSSALVPDHCAVLEADALSMTRKCIRKFTDEGRNDFISAAKELERTIIDQIESEDGLTRRYMNADLKMQMLLYERGYSTRENVIRGVRSDAWDLKRIGYVPKWLDEEFPLRSAGE